MRKYTQEELSALHDELYKILNEINRICNKYDISYFAMGGSAIGALYDKAILPWDDDIDIGMTREHYNKFLEVAPLELGNDYFLSWIKTDPHTPFFYAKVKKNGTLFVEEYCKEIPMHQGVFIDIFPYDKASNNRFLQFLQFKIAEFIKCCLMAKEVWMWKYWGRSPLQKPLERSFLSCLLTRIVNVLFPKKTLYSILVYVQSFSNRQTSFSYKLINTYVDYISEKELSELVYVPFGSTVIMAPRDLKEYRRDFHRYTEEEVRQKGSHFPYKFSLSSDK